MTYHDKEFVTNPNDTQEEQKRKYEEHQKKQEEQKRKYEEQQKKQKEESESKRLLKEKEEKLRKEKEKYKKKPTYDYKKETAIKIIDDLYKSREEKIVNSSIEYLNTNVQKFNMIKPSPILRALNLEESYIIYEKKIKNNMILDLKNVKIVLDFYKDLYSKTKGNYEKTFDKVFNSYEINPNNKIMITLPSFSKDKNLLEVLTYNYKNLSKTFAIELGSVINLNVDNTDSFLRKIYLYEVTHFNEIIGEANFEFGNNIIAINKNLKSIF